MEFKKKKKNHTQTNIYNLHNYSKKKSVYNYVHNFPKNIHNIVH